MKGLLRAFRDISIRKKLILSYCVVIIVPLCVLGVYSYRSANADMKRQLHTSAMTAADQLSSELGYRFERQEYPIKSIVFNPKVINAVINHDMDVYQFALEMNEDVEPIFWNYLSFMSEMKEIVIYSENRQSPFGNFVRPAAEAQEQAWYEQTALDATTRWWSDGEKLFATRNIYEPGQSVRQGILYFEFDFDRLIREVVDKVGPADRIAIESDAGATVYSTLESGGQETASEGEYMSYRRSIAGTGWTMSYYASTRHIGERTADILQATFILLIVCLAVLLVIVLLFSRTLLRGLTRLNERMKQVEEGELDLVVSATSKDEIGQLTNRFGHMLRQINTLIADGYENLNARKEAEFIALQEQIKPHFLYNSLSLVNSQAIGIGALELSRTVTLLARFYRTALNKGREQIAVRDELTMVQTYVEIQRIMSGQAFTVRYELDESIERHTMIRMILQPLVENAIDHGLKEKLEGERLLVIQGYTDGTELVFVIRDTGAGMEESTLAALLSEHSPGYGLRNVQQRIRLAFGEPYGLALSSKIDEGTTVTVRLPLEATVSVQRNSDTDR